MYKNMMNMAILERSTLLKARPQLILEIIIDAHGFAQVAPNLSRVHHEGWVADAGTTTSREGLV